MSDGALFVQNEANRRGREAPPSGEKLLRFLGQPILNPQGVGDQMSPDALPPGTPESSRSSFNGAAKNSHYTHTPRKIIRRSQNSVLLTGTLRSHTPILQWLRATEGWETP